MKLPYSMCEIIWEEFKADVLPAESETMILSYYQTFLDSIDIEELQVRRMSGSLWCVDVEHKPGYLVICATKETCERVLRRVHELKVLFV